MEYTTKFSKRKTLSISVKRDLGVVVYAPIGTSRAVIDGIVRSKADWIRNCLGKMAELKEKHPEPTAEQIARLKQNAKDVLPRKTAHFAKIMGLNYGRITITSAKTRFGSCSSKGNISYSYRLMEYPEEAIDYVVVHELAHLREMNHSREFYKIVESVLPDYRARKKLLKY